MTHDRLIDYLEGLAAQEDRAALAALRSSLREGRELDALRIVLPVLPRNAGRWAEDDASLVAALFALHPRSGPLSVAAGLRAMTRQGESESVENRFRALLGTSRADLPNQLRHAVGLLESNDVPIDWRNLYRAVRHWEHPENFVRRQWARDFWGAPHDTSSDEGPTD